MASVSAPALVRTSVFAGIIQSRCILYRVGQPALQKRFQTIRSGKCKIFNPCVSLVLYSHPCLPWSLFCKSIIYHYITTSKTRVKYFSSSTSPTTSPSYPYLTYPRRNRSLPRRNSSRPRNVRRPRRRNSQWLSPPSHQCRNPHSLRPRRPKSRANRQTHHLQPSSRVTARKSRIHRVQTAHEDSREHASAQLDGRHTARP
jgi:hypothetical protein